MKLLFLDIDGVLNSVRSAVAHKGYPWPGEPHEREWEKFDEVAVRLLQDVVGETGASVVLSSVWRIGADEEFLKDLSERLGVEIKYTTNWSGMERGWEINKTLKDVLSCVEDKLESYVIIDDDSDMLSIHKDRFVKVDGNNGLSFENYMEIINVLGIPLTLEEEHDILEAKEGETPLLWEVG